MATTTTPQLQLSQLAIAYRTSRVVHVAAELGIADHIAHGVDRVDDLARVTGTYAPSLFRLLRCLCGLGMLTPDLQGRFRLTDLGCALRSDLPGSAYDLVRAVGLDVAWDAWKHLREPVTTAATAFDVATGDKFFDYLARHPEEASIFNGFMQSVHGPEARLLASAYDFTHVTTVVDLGGGTAGLLTTILQVHPHLSGILHDLPHIAKEATRLIAARGLGDRCRVIGGNFFQAVPTGGEVYILSHILHDWDESHCRSLLGACRNAMSDKERLLVVERVLSGDNDPGALADMAMMVLTGGRELTRDKYAELFDSVGLRLLRTIPLTGSSDVMEVGRA